MPDRLEAEDTHRPRRILVPVGDDRTAGAAFDHATALAGALDAELLLLGINAPPLLPDTVPPALVVTPADFDAQEEGQEGMTRARLLEAQDRVPSGVRCRTAFAWGPAGPAIIDAVRDEAVDLVVVPMVRGGAVSHLLHDGADRHVLHQSPVPVLVVPGP